MGLAPTTSTTAMLAMGDALAVVLISKHRFNTSDFKKIIQVDIWGNAWPAVSGDIMITSHQFPIVSTRIFIDRMPFNRYGTAGRGLGAVNAGWVSKKTGRVRSGHLFTGMGGLFRAAIAWVHRNRTGYSIPGPGVGAGKGPLDHPGIPRFGLGTPGLRAGLTELASLNPWIGKTAPRIHRVLTPFGLDPGIGNRLSGVHWVPSFPVEVILGGQKAAHKFPGDFNFPQEPGH